MSGKFFLDTNILVYAHTDLDKFKQATAHNLTRNLNTFISTQVLQELANTLNRKFKLNWDDISQVLADAATNNNLHPNTEATISQAVTLAAKYRYSFYDSMIISAALEIGCEVLYSEDMSDGQLIEKRLTIINPFTQDFLTK